ncbi:MAG TPA: DUF1330 domain-containing protein [Rhodospirillaceae bacterium]|nr:DUF1330 domain-containing protein [Magnetovibrio sp.]HBT42760.1 DUF1330 domain-containing protein [Rhodospirillaceae bacterium]HCS71076.1 DUF1330 domain-containing protein [Rhodospirillaceae bacterium]|tara:strand:- start:5258 stop:5698 length:441 start_codon:yes stop_codon:yes gene_type:complete
MAYTAFTRAGFRTFRDNNRGGPVHMLNLIKLRPLADYGDEPPHNGGPVTGAEAYAAYGRESAPVLARLGARIVWRGRLEQVLIGPDDEAWDVCFIAEYPSSAGFADMVFDPQYRTAMRHRQAAVADSRLIRLNPLAHGTTFNDPED